MFASDTFQNGIYQILMIHSYVGRFTPAPAITHAGKAENQCCNKIGHIYIDDQRQLPYVEQWTYVESKNCNLRKCVLCTAHVQFKTAHFNNFAVCTVGRSVCVCVCSSTLWLIAISHTIISQAQHTHTIDIYLMVECSVQWNAYDLHALMKSKNKNINIKCEERWYTAIGIMRYAHTRLK